MSNPNPPNRWKPGQSGNPLGRYRKDYLTRELEKVAQEMTEDGRTKAEMVARELFRIALDPEEDSKVRIQAAKEIMNRVEGKALQKVEIETGDSVGELVRQAWATVSGGEPKAEGATE